jgi:hypothetical protein
VIGRTLYSEGSSKGTARLPVKSGGAGTKSGRWGAPLPLCLLGRSCNHALDFRKDVNREN